MITTCFGGRNVRCAAEFIRRGQKDSWDEIEDSMLGGMKMQGQLTCKEVHEVVKTFDLEKYFPLFEVTYQIAFEKRPPQALLEVFMVRVQFLNSVNLRHLSDKRNQQSSQAGGLQPYTSDLRAAGGQSFVARLYQKACSFYGIISGFSSSLIF